MMHEVMSSCISGNEYFTVFRVLVSELVSYENTAVPNTRCDIQTDLHYLLLAKLLSISSLGALV